MRFATARGFDVVDADPTSVALTSLPISRGCKPEDHGLGSARIASSDSRDLGREADVFIKPEEQN
jgi:hypothetical protein